MSVCQCPTVRSETAVRQWTCPASLAAHGLMSLPRPWAYFTLRWGSVASCQDKTGKDQLQRLRLLLYRSAICSVLNTQHSTEPGKKQHLLRPNKVRKRVLLAKLVGLVFALQSDLLPLSDPRPSYTYFISQQPLCVCYHLSVHFLLIILYCLSIYFKFGEERNSAHVRLDGELQLFSAK